LLYVNDITMLISTNIAMRPDERTSPLAFEVPPGERVPLALLPVCIGTSAPLTTPPVEVDVLMSEDGAFVPLATLPEGIEVFAPPPASPVLVDLSDPFAKVSFVFSNPEFIDPPTPTESLDPGPGAKSVDLPLNAPTCGDTAPTPVPASALSIGSSVLLFTGTVVEPARAILLVPRMRDPEVSSKTGVPLIVTPGPPADIVVPAIEKPDGLAAKA